MRAPISCNNSIPHANISAVLFLPAGLDRIVLERNLERLLKLTPSGSQEPILKDLDRWLSRAPELSVETRVEVHHEVSPARRSVRFDESVKEEAEERPSRPSRPTRPRRYSSSCSSSSSSSSSEDEADYSLPQRKAYGGVRISYVPNDALAVARQKTTSPRVEDKNCLIS
jgi:hypothetical protein